MLQFFRNINNRGERMKCTNCNIEFQGRSDAKYCSTNCRVTASRKAGVVTDNVTLSDSPVTDNFEFYTIIKANGLGRKNDEKSPTRKAKYWYDVPIAAIPVIKKNWPKMPEFMNGRQYFLWWKNEFKINDKEGHAGFGQPEIHNPFPSSEKTSYVQAGENSRHWGTN